MAESSSDVQGDPLSYLRQSIVNSVQPILSTSASVDTQTTDLAAATHLVFPAPTTTAIPFDIPTRFISSDKAINLRSILFAWQHKDETAAESIAAAEGLNAALTERGLSGTVHNLLFVERVDLVSWLEGSTNESDFIKPLESDRIGIPLVGATEAGANASVATTITPAAIGARQTKTVDPRLQEIFNNERRMGDRNTVLRGIKPTDFSHVRKIAENYLKTSRQKPGATANGSAIAASASLVSLPKQKSSRRPDPIILLSPSASSLLRMSNIRSFLEKGVYTPPDSSSLAASTSVLHISRSMPTIDSSRPLRFILVDSTEQFKPDYWGRVVAVFTTGQAWQFKGYKWQSPQELFGHLLGVYVGWRGDEPPDTVKGWGRGVVTLSVEKWVGDQQRRWRDREVVEQFWNRVEEAMRREGWSASGLAGN